MEVFTFAILLIQSFKRRKIRERNSAFSIDDFHNFFQYYQERKWLYVDHPLVLHIYKNYDEEFIINFTTNAAKKLGIIRQAENGSWEFVEDWDFADYPESSGRNDGRGGGRGGGSSDDGDGGGDGGDGDNGSGIREILSHPILFSQDQESLNYLLDNLLIENLS